MATAEPSCDICLNLHVTKSASVWCSECEEAICQDCEQRHRIQKATKNHKTIPTEDYQELPISITNIKLECEDHNRKLDFYCSIHNEPCCTRCVSEKHKDCRELKPLPEVADGVKSSAALSDLQDRVSDMSQIIGQLIQEKLDNKSTLQIQSMTIIAEVERVRKAVNKHLDTIQEELLTNHGDNDRQQRDNIDCLVDKLSKMKTNVDEIANAFDKTKQHASNFQTFLGINKWIREIENHEMELRLAQNDQSMANLDIQMKINPFLSNIERDVSEFGKLEINFSPPTKLVLRKDQQGQQILIPSSPSINQIQFSTIRSFDIPKGESQCMITGCDMFEDERMIFVDSRDVNKRIVVMNNKGSFIKEIKFKDIPFDVTVIDSNTAAVTLYKIKNISIVDVNVCKTLQTITVNNKCYGIRFIDGKLFVSMGDKTIKIFNLSGNVLSTVSKHNEATYCSVMNQTIYYAAREAAIIYCCDLNGSAQWKFSCEKFEYPKGITHDSSGNVFVACRDVNKVIVIEFSGKETRVLLTCDDGVKRPLAIHYNRKSDILLVCNRSGQCFMYKIIN